MPRRKPSALALNGFTPCPKCGGPGIKETPCVSTNPRPVEPAGRRA